MYLDAKSSLTLPDTAETMLLTYLPDRANVVVFTD